MSPFFGVIWGKVCGSAKGFTKSFFLIIIIILVFKKAGKLKCVFDWCTARCSNFWSIHDATRLWVLFFISFSLLLKSLFGY